MIRLSDPPPAFCSACHNSDPDGRYVDFEAAHDGGAWQDETLAYVSGAEDLHICERCMRNGLEALAFKPELHSRQLNEIRRQEIVIEHWRAVASKQAALIESLQENIPEAPRRVGRPTNASKVAA